VTPELAAKQIGEDAVPFAGDLVVPGVPDERVHIAGGMS